jgi:hypothetical protein
MRSPLFPLLAAAIVAIVLAAKPAVAVYTPESEPAVPPEKAAKPLQGIAIANAGFEAASPGAPERPDGWVLMQHAGEIAYRVTLDSEKPKAGKRSARVESLRPEVFGSLAQTVSAAEWRGRTLRFSGWIRTKDVKGNDFGQGVGLFLNSMRGGAPLLYAQMSKTAVAGTTGWTRYEVTLKVPAEADNLEIGIIQFGEGTAWVDDVALDVVPPK